MSKINDRYGIYPIREFIGFLDLVDACRQYGAVVPGREEIFQVVDFINEGLHIPRALTLDRLEIFWRQHVL